MSTSAIVIVKDRCEEHWFYRHADAGDHGRRSLETFLSWVKEGRIRDSAGQAAGWLIVLGHSEYGVPAVPGLPTGPPRLNKGMVDWKVGAYEPLEKGSNVAVDYIYTVDLIALSISRRRPKC